MLDFLRNLTKTEAEKQQETLSAYLDNALSPAEQQEFEAKLSADTTLRASLEQQRLMKQNISQLPQMRAPRNFILDPAVYGRPTSPTVYRLYPAMRAATALAAVLLIFLFSLQWFSPSLDQQDTVAQAPTSANGVFEEAAENPLDEDSAGAPVPAAVPEIMSEESGEVAADAEEAAEEATEEEAAEEMEVAAEETMSPPAEAAPVEEPLLEGGGVEATEQTLTVTGEADTNITGAAGSIVTPSLTLTDTFRSDSTATQLYSDTGVVGSEQLIPTLEPERTTTADPPSIPPIQLLQIGLGILFLALLAATWLLRRQL